MSATSPTSTALVWLEGDLIPANDLRLPVWNHGVGVADGVYETFRTWAGLPSAQLLALPRLEPHLERLERGCEMLSLRNPLSGAELLAACIRTLEANGLEEQDARLRVVVWRCAGGSPAAGGAGAGAGAGVADPSRVAVYALPVDQPALDARRRRGLRVISLRPSRVPGDPFHTIKHLNGIRPVLARLRCEREGADDALFLNCRGEVCEAVWSNIFLLEADGATLRTPPADSPCLPGVTRERLLRLAADAGLQVREEAFCPSAFQEAREAFATSSVSEVMPIVEADGTAVGDGRPGEVAWQLQEAFRASLAFP